VLLRHHVRATLLSGDDVLLPVKVFQRGTLAFINMCNQVPVWLVKKVILLSQYTFRQYKHHENFVSIF
jgi:hypothetical protein